MVTRRDFLKTMTMASAGLAAGAGEILNAQTLSSSKNKNEKVKIAYVGIGNRGQQIIEDFARTGMVEVVALCDVDMGAKHTQKVIGMYPKAKQFRDIFSVALYIIWSLLRILFYGITALFKKKKE